MLDFLLSDAACPDGLALGAPGGLIILSALWTGGGLLLAWVFQVRLEGLGIATRILGFAGATILWMAATLALLDHGLRLSCLASEL